jgi:hypothetical protein
MAYRKKDLTNSKVSRLIAAAIAAQKNGDFAVARKLLASAIEMTCPNVVPAK